MRFRYSLLLAVVLAALSVRCAGSPAKPEGSVTVTVTTSTTTSTSTTTTSIPPLVGGGVSVSPGGAGIMAATAFTFSASAPSGGVEPYVITWKFGDGDEGAGPSASHIYPTTGTFGATATFTDSQGKTAQASTSVAVRNVSGRWTAVFDGGVVANQAVDLVQNGAAVNVLINAPGTFNLGTGSGNVSNPRNLSVTAAFATPTAPPTAFGATLIGRIDETLSSWRGTATGFPGCPCTFTATRPPFVGDSGIRN
jgi:PKD domain